MTTSHKLRNQNLLTLHAPMSHLNSIYLIEIQEKTHTVVIHHEVNIKDSQQSVLFILGLIFKLLFSS